MATYGERAAQLAAEFQLRDEERKTSREQQDAAINRSREERIGNFRAKKEKEEKELREAFKREDAARIRAREMEDQAHKGAFGQAVLNLSAAVSHQPSESYDPPKTPEIKTHPREKKRTLSPDLQIPPEVMSSFERKRLQNMAQNQAILN